MAWLKNSMLKINNSARLSALLGLIFVLGAGCQIFGQKSDEIVLKMVQNISQARSTGFNLKIDAVGQKAGQENPDWQLGLILEGSANFTAATATTIEGKVSGNLNINNNSASAAQTAFAAEIKLLEGTTYLKITEPPAQPFGNMNSLKDKWYKLSQITASSTKSKLTDEQAQNIRKLAQDSVFFTVTKKLKDENIQNIAAHHYLITLNIDALRNFIKETQKITQGQSSIISDTMTESYLNTFKGAVGEIWIGKNDLLLYRLKMNNIYLDETKGDKVTMAADLQLSNVNQPVQITAPAESADLSLVELLVGGALSGVTAGQADAANLTKDSDHDGLTDFQEAIYKTDAHNPDSDGDGYKDGQEVTNGYDPLGPGKLYTAK